MFLDLAIMGLGFYGTKWAFNQFVAGKEWTTGDWQPWIYNGASAGLAYVAGPVLGMVFGGRAANLGTAGGLMFALQRGVAAAAEESQLDREGMLYKVLSSDEGLGEGLGYGDEGLSDYLTAGGGEAVDTAGMLSDWVSAGDFDEDADAFDTHQLLMEAYN